MTPQRELTETSHMIYVELLSTAIIIVNRNNFK